MKKILIFFFVISHLSSFSKEGMWIPMLLQQMNISDMQSMGLKISAEQIYSINQASIKDAIVLFGGGCTAEIVSDKGLMFTNHHCGISVVQSYSTLQNDYLTNGFWANNFKEELPANGLTATILFRMEDVTDKILNGLSEKLSQIERTLIIAKRCAEIEKEAVKGTHYKAKIRPFYNGNQYYLMINEVFKDVRLVGSPPSSIGKFGGDTDNWMWPRHTGDFCVFRIYVDKDNKPADYSAENVPYTPRYVLPISLKGVKENDFTFVYGYPGRTQEYLPSYAVEMTTEIENPIRIDLREKRLGVINEYMKSSKTARIQYTAKYASIANFWKKMIGESFGIKRSDAINKKRNFEKEFVIWASKNNPEKNSYIGILQEYSSLYDKIKPYNISYDYLTEAPMAMDILKFVRSFNDFIVFASSENISDSIFNAEKLNCIKSTMSFYSNYSIFVEKKTFSLLMKTYYYHQKDYKLPSFFKTIVHKYKNNYDVFFDHIFTASIYTNKDKLISFLQRSSRKQILKLKNDELLLMANSFYEFYFKELAPIVNTFSNSIDSINRIYMKAIMEMQSNKLIYPDANSTLRVSYGKVEGFSARDAIGYSFFTTLDGVIEKEDSTIYDYKVDPLLKKAFFDKDYVRYSDANGKIPVCFIASNHTTGGNSGSPVLNSYGELIGINFDRNWEGTMSDLNYDISICRNITLDIRYCLFIIDKFSANKHILNELSIRK